MVEERVSNKAPFNAIIGFFEVNFQGKIVDISPLSKQEAILEGRDKGMKGRTNPCYQDL